MTRPIPKAITLRLTSEEAAALAVCRSDAESKHERRFSVKAVLMTLLEQYVLERPQKHWELPLKSPLDQIQAGKHAAQLGFPLTPEMTEIFKTVRYRLDGTEVQYGEADIFRVLVLRYASQSQQSSKKSNQ